MNETMNQNKYFIYTGNAYPHKNLEKLIEAILLMNGKLKIVSARSIFINRLETLIKEKKAQKNIEIVGFVDDNNLKFLYKNSVAFVFPTLAEGFGLPPMEAINAGTLAAVSNIPVLKEVYEESVFYFDPISVGSIKTSLENILKISEEERKNQIAKSQEFLKKYSWLKMAKATLKIYESSI
jgi:glycosyltransferase involved in cell wall biosynthesis